MVTSSSSTYPPLPNHCVGSRKTWQQLRELFEHATSRGETLPTFLETLLSFQRAQLLNDSSIPPPPAQELVTSLAEILKTPLDPLDIASNLDSFTSAAQASAQGAFYTPPLLCHWMVAQIPSSATAVLDPACGAGAFLVATLRRFANTPLEIRGIDINPTSIECTRQLLAYEYSFHPEAHARIHLDVGNFLDPDTAYQPADYIIGNPPFGTGRRANLSSIREFLPRYTLQRGTPNLYTLFIERALLLLPPKGSIAFITPDAWLGIDSGVLLRRHLLEQGLLQSITQLDRLSFGELAVETIVVTLSRQEHHALVRLQDQTVPAATLLDLPDAVIPVPWDEESQSIARALENLATETLGSSELFSCAVGIQAYRTGGGTPPQTKEIVASKPFTQPIRHPFPAGFIPYLEPQDMLPAATDSRPGQFAPARLMLAWGEHLAEAPELARYRGTRVVVREILGTQPCRVQAAVVTELAVYNRSLLDIWVLSGDLEVARGLCTLITSEIGAAYFFARGRKSRRTVFPKLVLADLKNFPFSPDWIPWLKELGSRYDQSYAEQFRVICQQLTLDVSHDYYASSQQPDNRQPSNTAHR